MTMQQKSQLPRTWKKLSEICFSLLKSSDTKIYSPRCAAGKGRNGPKSKLAVLNFCCLIFCLFLSFSGIVGKSLTSGNDLQSSVWGIFRNSDQILWKSRRKITGFCRNSPIVFSFFLQNFNFYKSRNFTERLQNNGKVCNFWAWSAAKCSNCGGFENTAIWAYTCKNQLERLRYNRERSPTTLPSE